MENQIRQILSQDARIDVALLFGSHVSGRTTPMSDVDIGIITNQEMPLIELGYLIVQLESALQSNVDLIVLNDVYKRNPQLAFNIVSHCRVVLCRNEDVLVNFKRNTYLYYFDTEPLRTMVNAAFRKRLATGKFGVTNDVG
jgi:predicted nucleotidyltransferase